MLLKLAVTLGGVIASVVVYREVAYDVPYVMVDEVKPEHIGHEIKVHGWVVPGSIETSSAGRRYSLQRNNVKLRVLEHGAGAVAPIRDQEELVVTGTIVNGYLEAEHAAQKCPRNYGKYAGAGDGTLFE